MSNNAENNKKNILFLVLDGFRGDLCFGKNKTSKTPNIDKLIENGICFHKAISSGMSSTPSVSSILTSLYPFESLVQDGNLFKINPNLPTFVNELQKNGYFTYAIIQDPLSHIGFKNIFGKNLDTYDHANEKLWSGLGSKIITKIIDIKKSNPWFCYIQLYDLNLLIYPNDVQLEKGPLEIQDSQFGKNHYERIISAQDKWIGKIIDNVDMKNTLIIFTADHGLESGAYDEELENFDFEQKTKRIVEPGIFFNVGMKMKSIIPFRKKLSRKYVEHVDEIKKQRQKPELTNLENFEKTKYKKRLMELSVMFKSNVFDDRIHVPLIFSGVDLPKKIKINNMVRSIDIFPTIFDICGLSNNLMNRRGRSLTPFFSDSEYSELPVFIESSVNVIKSINSNVIGIRTSKFKYFRDKNDPKKNINLFNLLNDPLEECNIANDNPKLIESFESELEKINSKKIFEIKENQSDDEIGIEEAKEIEKKLKDAGYIA